MPPRSHPCPVVRQFGDNEMVGRLVAQRRLRYIHVLQSGGRSRARLALREFASVPNTCP